MFCYYCISEKIVGYKTFADDEDLESSSSDTIYLCKSCMDIRDKELENKLKEEEQTEKESEIGIFSRVFWVVVLIIVIAFILKYLLKVI